VLVQAVAWVRLPPLLLLLLLLLLLVSGCNISCLQLGFL